MICYVWSSSSKAYDIRSLSDLYLLVVNKLKLRFFGKYTTDNNINLEDAWEEERTIDEFEILKHVAYFSMTGGGIHMKDEERFETLIIKGHSDEQN